MRMLRGSDHFAKNRKGLSINAAGAIPPVNMKLNFLNRKNIDKIRYKNNK